MSLSAEEICRRVSAFAGKATASEVAVKNVRPLAGGASRAAYALDITVRDGEQAGDYACVLRLDLGGKIYETSLNRVEEYRLLKHVGAGGVMVPRALWASDDPSVLERDFVILERVEGETIGRRIVQREDLAGGRRALGGQMGEQLAKIHAIDFSALEFLPRPASGERPAQAALRRCREELDKVGDPHPALEAGWRWLDENAPNCEALVLVHGDYRLGNFIVGPEGLRSILDWEFSSVGDRHEDLAWPFVRDWRFGKDDLRLGEFRTAGIFCRRMSGRAAERWSGRPCDIGK